MSRAIHLVLLATLIVSAGPRLAAVLAADDTTSRPAARAETEACRAAATRRTTRQSGSTPVIPRRVWFSAPTRRGLHAFDLAGKRVQAISEGSRPDNVDVLYDFPLDGRSVDLAVAGSRSKRAGASRSGSSIGRRAVSRHKRRGRPFPPSAEGSRGSCVYRSPKDGRFYVFVNDHDGRFEQYRIEDAGGGKVGAKRVRTFHVGSQAEGCVADHELGNLFVAGGVGIWKFAAEPDGGDARAPVARVGENGLTADVEGPHDLRRLGGKGLSHRLQPGEPYVSRLRPRGEPPLCAHD